MLPDSIPIIGVIGGNSCSAENYALAEKVGESIAKAGAMLVCGGRGGIMEAASKGACKAGGTTIGILPGDNKKESNPYIKINIPTGMGIGRNILVVRTADALIACEGKYGTLSEISFALHLNKPVFSLFKFEQFPELNLCKYAQEAVDQALGCLNK